MSTEMVAMKPLKRRWTATMRAMVSSA
jgi:hypothetical protein